MLILNRRLHTQVEKHLADEQAGFRKDRGTVQQILALRLLVENARRKGRRIYSCFIDFEKAFDNINQEVAWEVLKSYGVNHTLIDILKDINENAEVAVRIQNELGNWFRTSKGTRQGDPISPQLFITILERAMDGVTSSNTGISIQGMRINNLRSADDIVLLEENPEDLSVTIARLRNDCRPYGMKLNLLKTKTMVFGERNMEETLEVNGEEKQNVEEFTYLGSTVTYDLDCKKEMTLRFAKAKGVLIALDTIWKNKEISLMSKLAILRTCVFSTALYACEAWVVTAEIQRRILAFERICYRKVLRIGWKQRITNEELYDRIHLKETLLQKVIRRKLQLFGYICRMDKNRKIKDILFGMVEGTNKKGRPHREWLDDIRQWCQETSIYKLYRAASARDKWNTVAEKALSTYGR